MTRHGNRGRTAAAQAASPPAAPSEAAAPPLADTGATDAPAVDPPATDPPPPPAEPLPAAVLDSLGVARQLREAGAYSIQEAAQWLTDSHPGFWSDLEAAAAALGE